MDLEKVKNYQVLDENGRETPVKEFLKLLMENRPEAGKEYAAMLHQVEGMTSQLNAALKELQEVKSQLTKMQEGPAEGTVSRVADLVEGRLNMVQKNFSTIKAQIAAGARKAMEGFRHMGVAALDKAVSGLGIKQALQASQRELDRASMDMEKSIKRIEAIGGELRSVGGHVKNIARAVAGKEQQTVDGGREGRFQAALLAPMRKEKKMLDRLGNMIIAAIGCVERLEQAAGRGRNAEKPSVVVALLEAKEITADNKKQADGQSKDVEQHQPRTKDEAVI